MRIRDVLACPCVFTYLLFLTVRVIGLPARPIHDVGRKRVATSDAVLVARLRAAGALLVGSTNMHEMGLGWCCANPFAP